MQNMQKQTERQDNSILKIGGWCSVLLGISYIIIGAGYLLLPPAQQSNDPAKFFPSYIQNPFVDDLIHWAFAIGALLALAVVLAITKYLRSNNNGWLEWSKLLALLGFSITAINDFGAVATIPVEAEAYVKGDLVTQKILTTIVKTSSLDPQGWLGFGGVGLWILIISLVALKNDKFPKVLCYIGIGGALLYWLTLVGFTLENQILIAIASGLGGVIIAPVFYIWVGNVLLRADNKK